MGIFTVAQILYLFPLAREDGREAAGLLFFIKAREVVRDHRVVPSGMSKHLLGEFEARLGTHGAFGADFFSNALVVGRIDDDGDRLVVLCSRTNHRRAADIDILNRVFKRAVGLGDRLLERVEIHDDDIDRIDFVISKRLHMFGIGTTGKNPGVDLRIERLDATVEHFGEAV